MQLNMNPKQWTDGSIFCYKRGCNCDGCFVRDLITSQRCYMKVAVIELVKKYGAPLDGLTKREQSVINAILAGANTKEEIAEQTDINVDNVKTTLCRLYPLAEEEGFYYTNVRNKLPQFIKWVKEKGFEE